MPSKSPEQARLMQAAAHNPEFAAKAGVPVTVAKEFVAADKKRVNQYALPRSKRKPKGG